MTPPGGPKAHPSDAVIAGLVSQMPANAPLALGFSGGGDSLYLLMRLRALFTDRTCHALIVDHALRAGSADDAEKAAHMARNLGAVPQVLRWKGGELHGHEAARGARYQLLARAMGELDIRFLWLAHTQDDQLETFCLRLAAHSGWRGLAGMVTVSPYPLWPEGHGLRLLRPMLKMTRVEIRTKLKAQDVRWVVDPANADRRHARVRMRDHLRELEAMGLDRYKIVTAMVELRAMRDVETEQVMATMPEHVVFDSLGFARLSPDVAELPENLLAGILARVTLTVSGAPRLRHSGTHLCEAYRAAQAGVRQSLNQCLWSRRDGEVWVVRDPGGVCGRAGIPPQQVHMKKAGEVGWFDGRWRMIAPGPGTVSALCDRFELLAGSGKDALRALPVMVRRTLPVWQGEDGALQVLPLLAPDACRFSGLSRGMETGKAFA